MGLTRDDIDAKLEMVQDGGALTHEGSEDVLRSWLSQEAEIAELRDALGKALDYLAMTWCHPPTYSTGGCRYAPAESNCRACWEEWACASYEETRPLEDNDG